MKFLRTYEEFKFKDDEKSNVQVLDKPTRPQLSDKPIDPTLLGGNQKEENNDEGSTIDNKGVVNIKNWKVY